MNLPHLSPSSCEHHLPPHATQTRTGLDAIAPGAPQTLRPVAAFRDPPLPVVTPSPGVPISWGLSPRVPHFRLSLSLKGPFPRPPGPRTGSQALTGPVTGRSAGQSAAGVSSGSTRRTTRTPGPPGPAPRAAGSDVRGRAKTGSAVSAHVRCLAAVSVFWLHLAAGTRAVGQEPGRGWLGGRGMPASLDGLAGETEAQRRKERSCRFLRT